jgi:flagellar basal-body rod modification protein FlgD
MTISTGNSYLDSLTGNPKSGSTTTTKKSNQTLDQSSFLKLLKIGRAHV